MGIDGAVQAWQVEHQGAAGARCGQNKLNKQCIRIFMLKIKWV
jgi:hypothetical protein